MGVLYSHVIKLVILMKLARHDHYEVEMCMIYFPLGLAKEQCPLFKCLINS